jgi:hypothetical protein
MFAQTWRKETFMIAIGQDKRGHAMKARVKYMKILRPNIASMTQRSEAVITMVDYILVALALMRA